MVPTLLVILLAGVPVPAESFSLEGRITTDRRSPASVQATLEESGSQSVIPVEIAEDGYYRLDGLSTRSYRLLTVIDGKRQDRRDVKIVCTPGSRVWKDFHYGKFPATLMLSFPAEDPDVVDITELKGEFPKDVIRNYERAVEDHRNGNVVRSVDRLRALESQAPGFYKVHARLGLIYQQEGCFSDSEDEYTIASHLNSRSAQALLNLASVQLRLADLPGNSEAFVRRALETLRQALDLNSSSTVAYCLTGSAYMKLGSIPEAEESFSQALEIDRSMGAAQLLLGNLYLRQEKWKDGIEKFEAYLQDHPFAPDRSVVKELVQRAEEKSQPD